MALKKFARRDVILPAVVFLLTFVVALFSLRLLSLNQEKDERLRAVYAAESTISRVSSQLNRYLAESDFIKKYIESGRVLREEEFAAISSNMQDGSSVIKTHELAKDGVVSQVYPVAGNEAAIGLDMLHNPARKKGSKPCQEQRDVHHRWSLRAGAGRHGRAAVRPHLYL